MLLPGRDRWTLRRPSSPALGPLALRGLYWVEEETQQFVWRKACSLKADCGVPNSPLPAWEPWGILVCAGT